ncbi:MAG: hypothetical protein QM703_18760 [Gemmatales bacterium]
MNSIKRPPQPSPSGEERNQTSTLDSIAWIGYAQGITLLSKWNMPTRRPTRWLLRITVALLMAFIAWWAVHELVRPQPCLRFTMPAGGTVPQARGLGPWLVIQINERTHRESDQLLFFDFTQQRFMDPPKEVNPSRQERWFYKEHIRANGTSIIALEKPGTIKVFDTIHSTLTKRIFPDRATLYLSEDGSTLLESTTLPLRLSLHSRRHPCPRSLRRY